ncbi:MAG: efflux RND transporter periplasmic adaptor subunit [Anaerolineaceae bacterium]|nr:efflux RND transporter periplasmic adaptor subunit [Anaerolineaceae bacterium]
MKNVNKTILCLLLVALMSTACSGIAKNGDRVLTASGTITAKSVHIAPEIGGRVAEVLVEEGEEVKAGDVLFKIDNEYIQSQYEQASAAVATAEAALATAKVQLQSAELQHQMAVQNSQIQFSDKLADEWRKKTPGNFELPPWYFTRDEEIEAAQVSIEQAAENLKKQKEELTKILSSAADNDSFVSLEKELAAAQDSYLIADAALDAINHAFENKELKDAAEDVFDLSKTQLENVQERYEQALDSEEAEDVLTARAAVGAAQTAYDEALKLHFSLLIGDDSLQVQAAKKAVEQAEKYVSQSEAGLTQAKAALKTIEIQLGKTIIKSPLSGVILARNLEEGELVGAGGVVFTVGNIDEVSLKVYIPEDQYGLVNLKQEVIVRVDSFPEKTYTGNVRFISDTAEFTPSNVQTVEGRKATVFAVEIKIPNANHDLKPGMPADVNFILD